MNLYFHFKSSYSKRVMRFKSNFMVLLQRMILLCQVFGPKTRLTVSTQEDYGTEKLGCCSLCCFKLFKKFLQTLPKMRD